MRKNYIFPGCIVTWAEEHLCNTSMHCINRKIKYKNCASEIFEHYLKTFRSPDLYGTNILVPTLMELLIVEILLCLSWCDFRNLFLKFVEITCIR